VIPAVVPGVVSAVADAARDADGADPLDEATRLRLKHHGVAEGELWTKGDEGFALRHGHALDLVVRPDARGRGVGGGLAGQAVAAPGELDAWSHGDHPAAAALATRYGFDRVRELWVMRRRGAEPLPDLVVPDGLTVRAYRPDDPHDRAELLRVNAAAFAHHAEQGAMDEAELAERTAEPWFDPAGLLVADDGSAWRGFHWTKRHDDRLGEVYVVGVDPAAQGQGLGRVLTLAGLHHLRDIGVAEVLLYVESDNAPAVHVYAGLGFGHDPSDSHVQYRRAHPPG
jgi:mycothiol synthase